MSYLHSERLEGIQSLLTIGLKLMLAMGSLVVIVYCGAEGILPDGFSFGDAFVLVCSILSFSVVRPLAQRMAHSRPFGPFA